MAQIGDALDKKEALRRFTHPATGKARALEIVYGGFTTDLLIVSQAALSTKDVYFWSKDIVQVVGEASKTIPEMTLTIEDLPGPTGFFWFDGGYEIEPITPKEEALSWTRVNAIAWSISKTEQRSGRHLMGPSIQLDDADIVHFVFFAQIMRNGQVASMEVPAQCYSWKIGKTIEESVHDDKVKIFHKEKLDEAYSARRRQRRSSFVAALLAFLRQGILVTPREQASRSSVRRLQKTQPDADGAVRVVKLRPIHTDREQGQADATVEWSCRWLVKGHWRKQYYPSRNVHQPKWIAPYPKGPEDKPLKAPSTSIFAVVR